MAYRFSALKFFISCFRHDAQEDASCERARYFCTVFNSKIFPDGIEDSRKQHDYAHQVFNEDQDHTAHPRSQVARSGRPPVKIKQEHPERREIAETQSATNGDVEMGDDAASMSGDGRDDTQTPSGEASHVQGQGESQQDVTEESRVQIPETQATDDSAATAAESVEPA